MKFVVNDTVATLPSRAVVHTATRSFWTNALMALGFDAPYLPLAALLKQVHGLQGTWMLASPVHWVAGHNDAVISACGEMLLRHEGHARIWFAEISQFLAQDGISMVFHDANTWLVRVDDKPVWQAPDVHCMLDKSFSEVLSSMEKDAYWLRLLTELQMFCSHHPLNTKSGELSVNGLWFWGAASLPAGLDKKIMTDSLALQAIFPDSLVLSPAARFTGDLTVIIETLTPEYLRLLDNYNQKNTCLWYWNNTAYLRSPRFWWSRLREHFTHAY